MLTWGHLFFAVMTTAYIVLGICLEDRHLRTTFGVSYDEYRQQVSMLIPWIGNKTVKRRHESWIDDSTESP